MFPPQDENIGKPDGIKWDYWEEKGKIMWRFARFGTICTIYKTWKTPMEKC